MTDKKEFVKFCMDQDILLSVDIIKGLNDDMDYTVLLENVKERLKSSNVLMLDKEISELIQKKDIQDLNWKEYDRARYQFEKQKNPKLYREFVSIIKEDEETSKELSPQEIKISKKEEFLKERGIEVVYNYEDKPIKREMQNFVSYFNARYNALEQLLAGRNELQGLVSINRIKNKKERETCSIIGLINEKKTTKNGNIMITIEDTTGSVNVLINKSKPDLFEVANNLTLDEVIGINGVTGQNIIFANSLVQPDIPLTNELKKIDEEAYAIVISDIHVGSNEFLPTEFNRFLKWIRGEVGNDIQRGIAAKTKYIFLVGDLVDGVGIYPGQEEELDIKDIKEQYDACAKLLDQIPKDKTIIIIPGNHDACRIAEPQPLMDKEYAQAIYDLDNAVMLSNPCVVNIMKKDLFPGFNFLLYHGYSFDYYAANIESIRNNGGYDRADLIMKFLLKRRHLAPTHKSTLYIPEVASDPLVINSIPDFFVSGHIHKTSVSNYKNITMICGSCWQGKTAFQEKVGHNPEPARVPIINLQTRDVKILKF